MVGKNLSHYRVLEELGRGGMGIVYKAEDTKLERTVALKVLPKHLASDEHAKKRFAQEAIAASRLEHQNICSIFHVDETGDGELYIVMPFYEGMSLRERIDEGEIPIDEIVSISTQIAKGLARAHSAGIIHRDIKPANVMLTDDRAVIMDFGVAKLSGGGEFTATGATVGSLAYMSPEQARGAEVDGRSDLWSLGAVMHEMVTGDKPFSAPYPEALLYTLLNEDPAPIDRGDVPEHLAEVIERLLEKDPENRYRSADDVVSAIGVRGEKFDPVADQQLQSRISRFVVGGIVIAAVLFLVWWMGLRSESPFEPGIDDRKVVILPFTIRGAEELLPWREEMVDALHSAIQGSEEVRSFDPNRIFKHLKGDLAASEDPDLAAGIAKQFGARWFVLGSVSKVGQVISVTPRLYKLDGEPVELRRLVLTDEPRLQAIADTLAQEIVGSILERPDLVLPSLASQTTDSPDAFKLYLIGTARLRERKWLDAKEAFESALELDSTFALAAFLLAQAVFRGQAGSEEDAKEALRLASRHAGRIKTAFRYLIDAEVASVVERNPITAEQHFLDFLKAYPDDGLGLQRYGDFLFHYNPPRGRPAEESRPYLEKGFSTGGDLSHMSGHLRHFARYDHDIERMTELHRLSDSLSGRPPDELTRTFRRMELAEAQDRGPMIDSLARANYVPLRYMLDLHLEDIHGAYRASGFMDEPGRSNYRLRLEPARGRFRMIDSLRLNPGMEKYGTNLFLRVTSTTLPFSPLDDDQLVRLRDEVISWDTTEVARFSYTHEHYQGAVKTYLLGLLAFRMEDDSALTDLVNDAMENEADSGQDLSNLVATTLLALQAVRAGDMDTALQLFDSAAVPFPAYEDTFDSPLYMQLFSRYIKAELLYEAGRFEEALPIYLSFLSGYDRDGLYVLGPAYLRRAQIYQTLGDEEMAIDFYERFVDLWRDADPELQQYVAEAEERLGAILKRPIAEPEL